MLTSPFRLATTRQLRAAQAAALLGLLHGGCIESHSAADASAPPDDTGAPISAVDAGPDLASPDGCVPFVPPACAQTVGLFAGQPYTHLVAFENTAFATYIGLTLMGPDERGCALPVISLTRPAPYEFTQEILATRRDPGGDTLIPGQVRIGSYESSFVPLPDGTFGRLTGTLLLRFPTGPEAMPIDVPICELRSSP
jgi:hypothetical protein